MTIFTTPRLRARSLCLAGTAFVSIFATPAFAQRATALPDIDVASDALPPATPPGARRITRDDLDRQDMGSSDTADILARLPGVSAFGAGGVSSLPVVRGLDNGRVGILIDGIKVDDACPNNMNPPLSYTDPQTVSAITVVTGVSPVSLGGDTIGGNILVETAQPKFAQSGRTLVTGNVSTFYRSNGDGFGGAASVTAATDRVSLTYDGSYTQSDNYEGGGNDGIVRSTEYAKTDHALTLAAQTGIGLFRVQGGIQRAPREGFPNQRMDMTDNRSWFLNGRWQNWFAWGDVDLTVHYRDTDHRMNFLADKGGTANGGMPMNTEVHAAGYTLKLSLPVSARDTIRVGSELHHQWLDDYWPPVGGSMMMGPNTFVNVNAAHRDRLGTYAEWEANWADGLTSTIGIRNDQVWMNTGDVQPYGTGMMQMADAMAAAAFNAADHARHDSNWSGSALLHYRALDGVALDLGYAHKVRSPNIYERYAWGRGTMASNMIGWFGDGNGYVGNLNLAPERADTISGAVTFIGSGGTPWSLKIAPWFTHVADYIDVVKLGDVRNMMGMPTGFVQLQFANREAHFYGLDVSGDVALWQGTDGAAARMSFGASWLHGQNLADDDPLYHQMPFNASVALDYANAGWDAHAEIQAVADKTRVDPTRVEPKTDGYTLVNLGTGYTWRGIRLGVEVANLFDTAYAPPLGGQSLGDLKATGILRPVPGRGRSFNLSLSAKF
ncbi:TonB-dependent receptor [Stakelama marina]|uniref:TonB-dependent receptor n=1 Tax=Stakelama marina TaxID=2826939 RepID=A0A8T4I9R5_9SPHN|nr:TonB-dependent receptor [Stakelama marina]MBR0551093.1 TonB-dependent receptor [Stakelama marina]